MERVRGIFVLVQRDILVSRRFSKLFILEFAISRCLPSFRAAGFDAFTSVEKK
ncbi:MAG: hypothetical protein LBP59_08875 [Planctomycetaceae bacterium]|nr:hypothetical protein [Planctomycetaceae bacterium]